jgi:hypothetical protein
MTKEILYQYLGTNGMIISPVHLEDIYYVRKLRLAADKGKVLMKQGSSQQLLSVVIPEDELVNWQEVEAK